jgi:hypothetical protein
MIARAMRSGSAVVAAMVIIGCSMSQDTQDQVLGGTLGALGGAAIGAAASGGDARAIGAGAAAGALTGWAAVKLVQYHAKRTSDAASENQVLGYREGDPVRIRMRDLTVAPTPVTPGSEATITMNYGLAGPANTQTRVSESIEIRDPSGKVVLAGTPREAERTPGGWQSPSGLPLPKNAPRGTYQVTAQVAAGSSHDEARTSFTVQ